MSDPTFVHVAINGLDQAVERLAEIEDALSADRVSMALRAVAFNVFTSVKERSPVGESRKVHGVTITGGRYRGAWALPDVSEGDGVVEAVIRNNVVYAHPVTYGSAKGQRPWPNAGPRTLEHEGRIYAKGGLSDESLARGGVVDPMMQQWAEDVIKEIVEGIEG